MHVAGEAVPIDCVVTVRDTTGDFDDGAARGNCRHATAHARVVAQIQVGQRLGVVTDFEAAAAITAVVTATIATAGRQVIHVDESAGAAIRDRNPIAGAAAYYADSLALGHDHDDRAVQAGG